MHYMLLPLERHFDDGLGATGEAFEEAAVALSENAANMPSSHVHLPVNFLYRHAVELFLKSMVVVLHRALPAPYGPHPSEGSSFVPVADKWTPIHRVHSVGALWAHVHDLLRSHAHDLTRRCRTDWQDIPKALSDGIAAIEQADASSTFLRYPDARRGQADEAKSSWKPANPDDILARAHSGGKPVKAVLVLHPDDTIAQAFQYDDAPLAELSSHLAETAKILSAAHTGLRVELADGF